MRVDPFEDTEAQQAIVRDMQAHMLALLPQAIWDDLEHRDLEHRAVDERKEL